MGVGCGSHFGVVGNDWEQSSSFRFILVESGAIWLVLVTPGVHHSFFTPDPDEGSPTGCLGWSPMGGEVTYICHISRVGVSL